MSHFLMLMESSLDPNIIKTPSPKSLKDLFATTSGIIRVQMQEQTNNNEKIMPSS